MSPRSFAAIPAVLLALSAVPALALDLSVGGSAGGSASGSTDDSGFSAGLDASASASASVGHNSDGGDGNGSASVAAGGSASASASGAASLGDDPLLDVMVLIRSSNWSKTSFSGLGDVDGATYDIDAWINSENSVEFDQTLEAHAGDIADLQYSIAANAAFSAWLESENADASAVVAVGVAADGSLAVFTHD